jgi:hypothetical protein
VALTLREHGLAPIPLGGDDGKVPLVRYRGWKKLPGRQFLERLIGAHSTANVGILTGLSGLTVVDLDDSKLLDDMLRRFGDTPLMTGTPSGGRHLWYLSAGEGCRTRLDGLKLDIRGLGGMVVVPPSIRPTGRHAGKCYTFVKGSWDDLCRLSKVKAQALKVAMPAPLAFELDAVPEGRRGNSLFLACLNQAPHCDTFDDLIDVARTINDGYAPPLAAANVVNTAQSAWRYQIEGLNFRGNRSHGAQVVLAERLFTRLLAEHPKRGPDALALYFKLQAANSARAKRGETFAVAARAMAYQTLPWSEVRIRNATKTLVDFGLVERVHLGGTGQGDAAQYTFRSPPPVLVSKMNTNVIRHPPPLAFRDRD